MNSVCFLNVDKDITNAAFEEELRKIFPNEYVGEDVRSGDLEVALYTPVKGKRKAVVKGFKATFADLQRLALNKTIAGRHIVLKQDTGEPRDELGNFCVKLSPFALRMKKESLGRACRRVTFVLTKDFLNAINAFLCFKELENTVYLNSLTIGPKVMQIPGRVIFYKRSPNKGTTLIRYASTLEAIQAIRLLNNNDGYGCPSSSFSDKTGVIRSSINEKCGLGPDGSIIELNDSTTIRFTDLDPSIVDQIKINSLNSMCWKCEKVYDVIGISVDFAYLIGKCACLYDSSIPITAENRAYSISGEDFTRLSVANDGSGLDLQVIYESMKSIYSTCEEYKTMVLPLLREDWEYSSHQVKQLHSTTGTLLEAVYVDTTDKTAKRGKQDIYGAEISIRKTKYWSKENRSGLKHVTLIMDTYNKKHPEDRDLSKERRARIRDVLAVNEKMIVIRVQVFLDVDKVPCYDQSIKVIPKLDKLEYEGTKRLINNLYKLNTDQRGIFVREFQRNVALKNNAIHKRKMFGFVHRKLAVMRNSLNTEQRGALEKAKISTCSLIQGPPGTGKTMTAATIVLDLATSEEGSVLCVAPSNIAADGLAEKIFFLNKKYGLKIEVVRVYAKSRESLLSGLSDISDNDLQSYPVMHREVGKYLWEANSDMVNIKTKLENEEDFKLTEEEREIFRKEVANIEDNLQKKFRVFVSTVAVISDGRFKRWTKINTIQTVLLDEAGQISQPSTLPILSLKPLRIVLIGDHFQLRATVQSFPAKRAGMDKSLLEWIFEYGHNDLPRTTLLEQHRMNPEIRQIVSNVAYDDRLRDAPSITSREFAYSTKVNAVFTTSSNVVVYDHLHPEEVVGNSFKNEKEADKILSIVLLLLKEGIPASEITLLTLYEAQRLLLLDKVKSLATTCPSSSLKLGLNQVTKNIHNVDGFQGRENSVVVVSFVRSNSIRKLGFTREENRINVALSRAKFRLVIVCNLNMWKNESGTNKVATNLVASLDVAYKQYF